MWLRNVIIPIGTIIFTIHESSFKCIVKKPFNFELPGTLAFKPLNSWGGGGVEKKSDYFVMSDLSEDTSSILSRANFQNILKINILVVQ